MHLIVALFIGHFQLQSLAGKYGGRIPGRWSCVVTYAEGTHRVVPNKGTRNGMAGGQSIRKAASILFHYQCQLNRPAVRIWNTARLWWIMCETSPIVLFFKK